MPTHGALSKAGKVRDQTPKISPTPKKKERRGPRMKNRRRYVKRILQGREAGQQYLRKRKRRRR